MKVWTLQRESEGREYLTFHGVFATVEGCMQEIDERGYGLFGIEVTEKTDGYMEVETNSGRFTRTFILIEVELGK